MEWMLMPFQRYAEFNGRSRRKEYWMFVLLFVIVYAVCGALMFGGGFSMSALEAGAGMGSVGIIFWLGAGLLGIFALAAIIPSIAVGVRRLHDRDMSGWWYLGFIVLSMIPFVGFIASIAFIVVMALPGTDGPNRFGPDPKNPTSANVFA